MFWSFWSEKLLMMAERGWNPNAERCPNCPRCGSCNTKFCYYNNYSLTQPRYFCKGCRRYWTKGGSLRNVPVGGGCRKSRRGKSIRILTGCVPSGVLMDTQGSCSSSISIDIAQVYANYLNKPTDNTEMGIVTTPQPNNISCLDPFPNASPYMSIDFNSYFSSQMGYGPMHCYTNINHVADDLPPLPGEEDLQTTVTGWESDIIENTPQIATFDPDTLQLEHHLITNTNSSVDVPTCTTIFRF